MPSNEISLYKKELKALKRESRKKRKVYKKGLEEELKVYKEGLEEALANQLSLGSINMCQYERIGSEIKTLKLGMDKTSYKEILEKIKELDKNNI